MDTFTKLTSFKYLTLTEILNTLKLKSMTWYHEREDFQSAITPTALIVAKLFLNSPCDSPCKSYLLEFLNSKFKF